VQHAAFKKPGIESTCTPNTSVKCKIAFNFYYVTQFQNHPTKSTLMRWRPNGFIYHGTTWRVSK